MLSAMSSTHTASWSWTTTEGRTVAREIIEKCVPQWHSGPRPFQLDCWVQTLARKPVVLIASTGGGKTAAFFGPILIGMQDLIRNPRPHIPQPPKNPIALVITPLIELGNNHARETREFGLSSISLSAKTLADASNEGRDLYKEIRRGQWSIIFISAERLISREFDHLIRDVQFRENLVMLVLTKRMFLCLGDVTSELRIIK